MFYLLECQPFVSVGQEDDAAIAETVFLEDVLQDVVIAVGIGTQVRNLPVAPFQAGGGYSFARFGACQAVDDAVGKGIFQPFSFVDAGIGGVVSPDEGEGSDDFSGIVEADVAVAISDVLHNQLRRRVVARPLLHVSVFAHDAFALFKDLHEDFYLSGLRLSDFYHKLY